MATRYLWGQYDTWYGNDGTNYGSGAGSRLQVGYVAPLESRVGISFSDNLTTLDPDTISEAVIRLKVLGTLTCWGKGSNPKMYVRRVTPNEIVTENAYAVACQVNTSGVSTDKYPGVTDTATTTDQTIWEDNPAVGDIIEIDVTDMYKTYITERGGVDPTDYSVDSYMTVALIAFGETNANNRIAFHSSESDGNPIYAGGSGPDMKITYSTNQTPSTPSVSLSPTGRVTGATITYDFDFIDPDGEQCHQCQIQAGTDATFASATLWNSGWVSPTTASAGRATKTHGGSSPTRGTQYYWRVKVRDVALAESGWSAAVPFDVNEYPVGTKTRPA